jgi:hypothetical protein
MGHQMEAGTLWVPLARGMMLPQRNPYPSHYKAAFAFSIFLYPQPGALGRGLPHGSLSQKEDYGLTTFRMSTDERVRSRLFAGGTTSAVDDFEAPTPDHLPFGPSLSAPLAWLH